MDGSLLLLFILATFFGGFVSGFSGFAMGIVVSGIWLHIITPIQTAALIAGYGLLTQGYGIAKLRHELSWQDIWPLTIGTAIGIPIGVMLLTHTNPTYLRFGVGVLLVLYATYSLVRPPIKMKIGAPADIAIGISNGLLGGLTGLGGIISTISCQWRGWSRDKQRSVFQPVLFAAFVDHLDFATHRGLVHGRNPQTVRHRASVHGCRNMDRLQTLRHHQRRDVSQDGVDPGSPGRRIADHFGIGTDACLAKAKLKGDCTRGKERRLPHPAALHRARLARVRRWFCHPHPAGLHDGARLRCDRGRLHRHRVAAGNGAAHPDRRLDRAAP